MDLLIGARQSDLARIQAYEVGDKLLKKNPELSIRYRFRQSLGDQNQQEPLWKMPEKGVFTKDFRESLLKAELDLVVHSWKDLPIDRDPPIHSKSQQSTNQPADPLNKTLIAGTLKRADSRDLLLFKKSHLKKVISEKKLSLFSSSPRRSYNLNHFFRTYFPAPLNHIEFKDIRGNILTRIGKMMENDGGDGLIMAKAAIDRLLSVQRKEFLENKKKLISFLKACLWQVLPLSDNPTAPGQGALALEIRSDRRDLKALLPEIHCERTWKEVLNERLILKSYGGGCHQKIGVTTIQRSYGTMTFLRGETEKGKVLRDFQFIQSKKGGGWQDSKNQGNSDPCSHIHLVRGKWFHARQIKYTKPPKAHAHFVAKARAVPDSEIFDSEKDLVWVSGQQTWKDLAQRGIWVNGSNESLGEREKKSIELLSQNSPRWIKWTHSQAPESPTMKKVATYSLIPKELDFSDHPEKKKLHQSSLKNQDFIEGERQKNSNMASIKSPDKHLHSSSREMLSDLLSYKALYWRSGSQFQWAVQQLPQLLNLEHYCGPGNSFTIINRILKEKKIKKPVKILPMGLFLFQDILKYTDPV